MKTTRKQFRFADSTLADIAYLKKSLGVKTDTSIVEIAIAKAAQRERSANAMHKEYRKQGWV